MTAQSYTPQPVTIQLKSVYDVRSWLVPHIEELHGHSQPHCFRFTLDEDGRAVMHYKNWSKDGWSETGLILLKVQFIYNVMGCQHWSHFIRKYNGVSKLCIYSGTPL